MNGSVHSWPSITPLAPRPHADSRLCQNSWLVMRNVPPAAPLSGLLTPDIGPEVEHPSPPCAEPSSAYASTCVGQKPAPHLPFAHTGGSSGVDICAMPLFCHLPIAGMRSTTKVAVACSAHATVFCQALMAGMRSMTKSAEVWSEQASAEKG